jgi:hypothetical protein
VNAREYYLAVQAAINAAPHVLRSNIEFDEIDSHECYVRGVLSLVNDLELHIAEYVITDPVVQRPKYRYHLQTAEGRLISRWDNVSHYPQLPGFPDHRHDRDEQVHPASPMDITGVLVAILRFLASES